MIAQLAPGVDAVHDKVKLVEVTPDAAKPAGTLGRVEHTAGAELFAADDLLDATEVLEPEETLDATEALDTAELFVDETELATETAELATEVEDALDEEVASADDAFDEDTEEVATPRVT